MANKNAEARASKLVSAVARKLAGDSSLLVPESLALLLRRAVNDLPPGEVRRTIEGDFDRFASLLCQAAAQKFNPAEAPKVESLKQLLNAAKGAILTDAAFTKAVEAVVTAVEKGAGKCDQLQEWIASTRRLLASRANVPLALWWSYAALELQSSCSIQESAERSETVVSTARFLMNRLKTLSVGRLDKSTEVAVLAPVVACLYDAATILSSEDSTKQCRKAFKSLKCLMGEILGFIAVCNRKPAKANETITKRADELRLDSRALVVISEAVSKLTGLQKKSDGTVLSKMFPLSPEAVRNSSTLVAKTMEFWAGVVTLEVFLLRLLVEIVERRKGNGSEVAQELKFLAVQGTSVLKTDLLLDLLMEHGFSFTDILSSDEEQVLRKILYEVMLFDLPTYSSKQLRGASRREFVTFLKKLSLARFANRYYRSHNERTKAVEVISRVSLLNVPNGFPKWSQKQGLPEVAPKGSKNLTDWLVQSADDSILTKLLNDASPRSNNEAEVNVNEVTILQQNDDDDDELFFVDVKGDARDIREDDALIAAEKAFVAATEDMRPLDSNREFDHYDTSESESSEDEDADAEQERPDAIQLDSTGVHQLSNSIQAVLAECGVEEGDLGAVVDEKQHEADVVMEEAKKKVEAEADTAEPEAEAEQEEAVVMDDSTAEKIELERGVESSEGALAAEKQKAEEEPLTPPRTSLKPETLQQAPLQETPRSVSRCTRSGRKYGDFAAPVELSKKKRRL